MNILIAYAVEGERINIKIGDNDINYVRTGVGKASAAARLAKAIEEYKPELVINLGTAGTVRHQVGEIVLCTRFVDRDMKAVNLPGINHEIEMSDLDRQFVCESATIKLGSCNTGDSFLTELSNAEDDVYDMESYAEAFLCKELGIPFIAIKYVTDRIGENSVKHWEDKLADARNELTLLMTEKLPIKI